MEATETKTAINTTETSVPKETKNIAIIAYVTLVGLIVAFVMNNEKKDPFAQYHIRQSLGLGFTGIALGIVGIIPFLGWIILIIGFPITIYMWVMGLINAINENEKPVPILGKKYEDWLKSI